jgi:hypothetical protein
MPASAYHQSSFLGGAIGPLSRGRSDLPMYRQALEVCMNGIVTEEGAWTRRSGFQYLAKTRSRNYAKLLPFFHSEVNFDAVMEFTDGYVRFFNGTSIVFTLLQTNIAASSFAANTLTLTVGVATGFAVGDDIMLWSSPTHDPAKIQAFRGRVMRITNIAGVIFTVLDEAGGTFSGISSTADDLVGCFVFQVAHLATSWTGIDVLSTLRCVQVPVAESGSGLSSLGIGSYAMILTKTVAPTQIKITQALVATIAAVSFVDGPYLDQQGTFTTPETGTVSAYSGSITFTPASSTFVAADIGRHIRLFQQPPAWAVGTTYAFRDVVTYNGEWWTSTGTGAYAANVGNIPGTPGTFSGTQVQVWAPAPDQGVWAWGTITAQATTSCTVSLTTALKSANGATISIWRRGAYTADHYPTCGVVVDGRLFLGGAWPGRWDASMSGSYETFSPTEANGTVNDDNAISYKLIADDHNQIYWMAMDQQGILVGTSGGEWLIHPLTEGAITPTNVRADRVTNYGCADMEPVRTGMALVFCQSYHRSLIEHLPEGFTAGRFVGRALNGYAKHFAESGIEEIAYQEETVPTIWARMEDGTISGCTYRRASRFITEEPSVAAFNEQVIGGSYAGTVVRPATSMCVIPSPQGLADNLYVVSSDTDDANYFVSVLRPPFEEA